MHEMNGMTKAQKASALPTPSAIEAVLARGDLSRLTDEQRVQYYIMVCRALGLEPLTQPFQYLMLGGRLVLYATRGATDQLRSLRGVSVEIVSREERDGLYVVHARARDRDGRTDESIGAVPLTDANGQRLKGEMLANAMMKAETKAKRRVTLSICGLGWLDEVEVDSVPDARPVEGPMPTAADVAAFDADVDTLEAALEGPAVEPASSESVRDRLARVIGERKSDLPPDVIARARAAWRANDEAAMIAILREIA